MIIKTSDLTRAISKVYPSTGELRDNDPIQRKDHFIFTGDYVAGYNGQFAIVTPLETDFICTVNAAGTKELFKSLTASTTKIVQTADKLKIVAGNIKAELPVDSQFDAAEYLDYEFQLLHIDDKGWQPLPSDFIHGMELCFFSALKKKGQPFLNSVFIDEDKIITADRSRISVFTMSEPIPGQTLIPLDTAKQLIKFSSEFELYKKTKNSITFAGKEGKFFIARTIAGDYPQLTEIMAKGKSVGRVSFPESIIGDLKAVGAFASGKGPADILEDNAAAPKLINVRINRNDIALMSESVYGKINSASKHSTQLKRTIMFSTNPDFLLEVLAIAKSMQITKGDGNLLKGFFTAKNFKHVVALLDITDEDVPF